MKSKLFVILFLLSSINYFAQTDTSFPKNLGIEFGIGSNELLWDVRDNNGDRSVFQASLSARIFYKIYLSENLNLKPIFGYIRYGGLSEVQDNGYQDEYYFDALQIGSLLILEQPNIPLQFSLGFKVKNYFKARNRSFGSFNAVHNNDAIWIDVDASSFFEKLSFNFGAGVGYKFSNFHLTMEYWIGIGGFQNEDLFKEISAKIKENHYRLFLGYHL